MESRNEPTTTSAAPRPTTRRVRRSLAASVGLVAASLVLATPVAAHGDHDARPLARHVQAGPYSISLWQVYPDVGSAMTPHLIVMFDDRPSVPSEADVTVVVNSASMQVGPSVTTANGWETTEGIAEGDRVAVSISDGSQTWALDPVVVPPPPTSMLPMAELLYSSIFLTIATALWLAGRTARAWRRPVARAT
jgi:hypothetical protein